MSPRLTHFYSALLSLILVKNLFVSSLLIMFSLLVICCCCCLPVSFPFFFNKPNDSYPNIDCHYPTPLTKEKREGSRVCVCWGGQVRERKRGKERERGNERKRGKEGEKKKKKMKKGRERRGW